MMFPMKKVCIMQVLVHYQKNSTSGYVFNVIPVSEEH